jgi:PAS domain S-box-containing protein
MSTCRQISALSHDDARRLLAGASDQEDIFHLLVRSVRDYSILVIDATGRIATWNEGARRIKGYEPAEIIGLPYALFFTPEDQLAGKPGLLLAEAARAGAVTDEGWRVRKDGSRFWASATLTALHDEQSGTLRGYAKITHDETAKHLAADALRRSEERFRLSVDALREQAFYMLSPEGLVESWNPGAERIKQYLAHEIIGRSFAVFFSAEDQASGKPRRELEVAASTGSFEEEGWRIRKDGSRFWASVIVTAVHDHEGRLRGFTKVTRDESVRHEADAALQKALERAHLAEAQLRKHAEELEQRVAERTRLLTWRTEALKRSNAELEQFAYIASHDLKEPLRMITSYLDLMRLRCGIASDARMGSYLSKVDAAARRMSELVEAVLEYSHNDQQEDALDLVPARESADAAIANLQQAISDSGARIVIGNLPEVRANRPHLTRVFQNLISNAIKFRSERPIEVRIDARADGAEWIISIADNGIGIDPAFHGKLFKIFQRLHSRDEYAGSGIGLASCKKIIEHGGGRIWVDSTPGAGSTFRFALPRATQDHP